MIDENEMIHQRPVAEERAEEAKQRAALDSAREKLFDKLTPEEREVLGIK